MFQTFVRFFTTKEVRNKIFFTLAMLVIFKIGTYIPAPGVNPEAFNHPQGSQGATELLNTFGGGALKRFSIFAMGIMPYITASIVMQLLQMDIVPKFSEWAKQGEMGRRKINNVTRYFAIILAFIQSIGMAFQFNNYLGGKLIMDKSIMSYLLIAVVLTAGTAFLIWLGDQITQFGVGNGISLIIFAGILSTLPSSIEQFGQSLFVGQDDTSLAWLKIAGLIVALILLTVGAIFVLEAKRKIPIQYAKKQSTQRLGTQATYLPLKVNSAGVIPVIFASSITAAPAAIFQVVSALGYDADWVKTAQSLLATTTISGMFMYAFLIVLFTFFYTFVQINPEKTAENLQKSGAYIPGVRPGKGTEDYMSKLLRRLATVGSLFLGFISILPILAKDVFGLTDAVALGGTSLLIIISTGIEGMKQLEGYLLKRKYVGFMDTSE